MSRVRVPSPALQHDTTHVRLEQHSGAGGREVDRIGQDLLV
ncbi:MAG: hypothetical protein ABI587_12735 [Gemmatimonadales bacterium]